MWQFSRLSCEWAVTLSSFTIALCGIFHSIVAQNQYKVKKLTFKLKWYSESWFILIFTNWGDAMDLQDWFIPQKWGSLKAKWSMFFNALGVPCMVDEYSNYTFHLLLELFCIILHFVHAWDCKVVQSTAMLVEFYLTSGVWDLESCLLSARSCCPWKNYH